MTNKYKQALEQELKEVEKELETVGRRNPDNPEDWEPVPMDLDIHRSEEDEVADKIEGFEENSAVLTQLEVRYNEIKKALEKIEKGDFGICEVCGGKIEDERLEANPAAPTCEKDM